MMNSLIAKAPKLIPMLSMIKRSFIYIFTKMVYCVSTIISVKIGNQLAPEHKSSNSSETLTVRDILRAQSTLEEPQVESLGACQNGEVRFTEALNVYKNPGHNQIFGPVFILNLTLIENCHPVSFIVDTGCSSSVINFEEVIRLGLQGYVDRTKIHPVEAMGGVITQIYGVLRYPLKTPSGQVILNEVEVLKMSINGGLLGLDVLSERNCSFILYEDEPRLLFRDRETSCCGFPRRIWQPYVKANLNGKELIGILDSGSTRTIVPINLQLTDTSLSSVILGKTAAESVIEVSRKLRTSVLRVGGIVGLVEPLVLTESHLIIGTDFLQNKRIDFLCGKVFLSLCE